MTEPCEPFGPLYPALGASVAKYQRKARHGLGDMLPADRRAYGDAVEKAILAKQRSELQRELPSHNVRCASGTNHNDGKAISAAVRAQHRAALQACPSQERRKRTDQQWRNMYDEAMAEKHGREMPLKIAA